MPYHVFSNSSAFPNRYQDSFRDRSCDLIKIFIKKNIVRIRVDKADLDQHRRHPGPVQHNQIPALVHALIEKADALKLQIDIVRKDCRFAVKIVDKGFNARILIGIRAGISMDGNKIIRAGRVCLHRLLIRRFIDIRRSGIIDIHTVFFKDRSDRKDECKRVILLLPSVVNRAGICSAMAVNTATFYVGVIRPDSDLTTALPYTSD